MNYYASLYFVIALTMMWQKWLISIPLSDTPIGLFVNGDEESTVLLYNMHDNENTSAMAGRIISTNFGGQYFELVHNGDRNISFTHGEDTLLVDPNRIYTDAGIWQQLAKNENADTAVFEMVATWRDSLLSILKITERSLVIALHNNTNKYYSIASYTEGGEYEIDADTVFQGRIRDQDDFYFVTDPNIFDILTQGRYHVVLQANETATDDGSLSVYCAQEGIPYINVEAQHNHLMRQVKMLIFAYQKLMEKQP